jgi:superfamily II DNA/RNA helicase
MLEMGFREPLKAILEYLPKVQTLLFSATMTRDIFALSGLCTNDPEKILLQGVSARQEEQLS